MSNIALKNLSKTVNSFGMIIKKNLPTILTMTGVLGVTGAGIAACVVTAKKLPGTMEEAKKIIEEARESDEKERPKNLTFAYAKAGLKFIKLYGPYVAIEVMSVGMIFKSDDIMHQRNEALSAMCVSLDTLFNEYRGRVKDKYGEDVDHEMRYGIHEEDVTSVDENGKEIKEKTKVLPKLSPEDVSIVFDSSNPNWEKNEDYRMVFLHDIQRYSNDELHTRGHIFVNDIYRKLGAKETKPGSILGFIDDGKTVIDFGLNQYSEKVSDSEFSECYLIEFKDAKDISDLAFIKDHKLSLGHKR